MSKHGVSLNQLVLFQDSRPHDVSIYCIPQVTTGWNFSPANMCKALFLEILVTTWNQQWKWSPTSSAVDKTDGPRVLEDIGILLLTCSTGWLGRIDFAQLYWNDSDLLLMRIPWWQIGNSIGIWRWCDVVSRCGKFMELCAHLISLHESKKDYPAEGW